MRSSSLSLDNINWRARNEQEKEEYKMIITPMLDHLRNLVIKSLELKGQTFQPKPLLKFDVSVLHEKFTLSNQADPEMDSIIEKLVAAALALPTNPPKSDWRKEVQSCRLVHSVMAVEGPDDWLMPEVSNNKVVKLRSVKKKLKITVTLPPPLKIKIKLPARMEGETKATPTVSRKVKKRKNKNKDQINSIRVDLLLSAANLLLHKSIEER